MFKKILVALDGSSAGASIFQTALSLAQCNAAELLLLHVLSGNEEGSPILVPPGVDPQYWSPGSDSTIELWRREWETYAGAKLEQLRSFATTANQANIVTEIRQLPGHPGRVICELAQSWDADLILIGSRGHSGLKELLLGSVSHYVLHHAPCSVLTLKLEP
ncbi:universal stress protein [Alkalinema pantanalense CENA528]|uniref:universal stress protein n=1 Tax=Alkalinema pantanalense TaxID=1620705 RepID=UPI003D6F521C